MIPLAFAGGEDTAHVENAKKLKAEAEYIMAEAEYMRASESVKDEMKKAEMLLLAGECAYYDDPVRAIDIFSKVFELEGISDDMRNRANIWIARSCIADGDYNTAIEICSGIFQEKTSAGQVKGEVGYWLAKSKIMSGNKEELRELLCHIIANNVIDMSMRMDAAGWLGRCYMSEYPGSLENAYRKMKENLHNIHIPEVFALCGIISNNLMQDSNIEEAEKMGQQFLNYNDENAIGWSYVFLYHMQILFSLKQYDAVISNTEDARMQKLDLPNEKKCVLLMMRGVSFERRQDFTKAIEVFNNIIKKNDVSTQLLAYMEIGYCFISQDNHQEALKFFELVKSKATMRSQQKIRDMAKSQIRFCNQTITGRKAQAPLKMNLKLDEKTAIKLAEIILVAVYGDDILKQRPWNVTDNGTSFTIVGTFHRSEDMLGGVAEIIIDKSDARVIKCIHGK